MSGKLRKEKDCLNCGNEVNDRFCPHCGQENTIHPESFLSMVRHYFDDLTHFDSKLFLSAWYLVSKPGYLTQVFNLGQRKKFVHPIRMYIFVSVVTFSYLFFATHDFQNPKLNLDQSKSDNQAHTGKTDQLVKVSFEDTVLNNQNWESKLDKALVQIDTTKTENWLEKNLKSLTSSAIQSFRKDPDLFTAKIIQNFIHNLPKTLLICLPLFALILFILFYKKEHFFVEHAIFSIHYHIVLLIWVLLLLILSNFKIYWAIIVLLFFYPFYYLYKSGQVIYKNSRLMSFIKTLIILVIYFFVISAVMVLNILYSISASQL